MAHDVDNDRLSAALRRTGEHHHPDPDWEAKVLGRIEAEQTSRHDRNVFAGAILIELVLILCACYAMGRWL